MLMYSLGFPDGASPIMEEFVLFHDLIMGLVIFIVVLVMFMIVGGFKSKLFVGELGKGYLLEWGWTFIPGLILVSAALPSLHMMYLYSESLEYGAVVKVVGRQWYWTYDFGNVSFDSYLEEGEFRLLDVDKPLLAPLGVMLQLLVTSEDVVHAWSVASMGLKVDAIPGRVNSLCFSPLQSGSFFGQCSEICGINHSFMPIVVEVLGLGDYLGWVGES